MMNNKRYSVRNYRLVENNIKTCISRGVARRFFKSATATRANGTKVIMFATKVVLLENKVKMRFY
ncbi:MAG: hypothetical protein LBC68_02930 [Prevotellaceae bacterium]|nr:hypothetical protein [Prevotellaceae bacterium]